MDNAEFTLFLEDFEDATQFPRGIPKYPFIPDDTTERLTSTQKIILARRVREAEDKLQGNFGD